MWIKTKNRIVNSKLTTQIFATKETRGIFIFAEVIRDGDFIRLGEGYKSMDEAIGVIDGLMVADSMGYKWIDIPESENVADWCSAIAKGDTYD